MVTARDQKALDFIELFDTVTPKQVSAEVYGSINVANNRLIRMTRDKVLFRMKNGYDGGYVYSIKPIRSIRQYRHKKLRTDFYQTMRDKGAVFTRIEVEKRYGSIKPDAVMEYDYKGNHYFILLEVELRAGSVDYKKYEQFFISEWKEYFNYKPIVVYVTDKTVNTNKYAYLRIAQNLSNISIML